MRHVRQKAECCFSRKEKFMSITSIGGVPNPAAPNAPQQTPFLQEQALLNAIVQAAQEQSVTEQLRETVTDQTAAEETGGGTEEHRGQIIDTEA
jgi:hypothetical protein